MNYGVFEYKGDKIFLLLEEFNNLDDATEYKENNLEREKSLLYILREPNLKIVNGDAVHAVRETGGKDEKK